MRHRDADIGITAAVAGLACVVIAVGAPVAITAVLGLALFVAPGYLLNEVLFDTQGAGLERVFRVTALAFCVPILGGVLLYVAGVPLHRSAWLGLLAGSTLARDAAAAGPGCTARQAVSAARRADRGIRDSHRGRDHGRWRRSHRCRATAFPRLHAAVADAPGPVSLDRESRRR